MTALTEALAAFQEVQQQYAEFGASDTEPRAEFYALIAALHDGREPEIPTTAEGWQLYSQTTGVSKAATALTAAARKAVAAAKSDTLGVAHFIRNY